MTFITESKHGLADVAFAAADKADQDAIASRDEQIANKISWFRTAAVKLMQSTLDIVTSPTSWEVKLDPRYRPGQSGFGMGRAETVVDGITFVFVVTEGRHSFTAGDPRLHVVTQCWSAFNDDEPLSREKCEKVMDHPRRIHNLADVGYVLRSGQSEDPNVYALCKPCREIAADAGIDAGIGEVDKPVLKSMTFDENSPEYKLLEAFYQISYYHSGCNCPGSH